MSKKARSKTSQVAASRSVWLWLIVAGVLLLVAGGVWVRVSSGSRSTAAPQGAGSPQLVVNRTSVDEGYVRFDVPVRTTFRLSNAGNQPLKILGEPQVELIEGC